MDEGFVQENRVTPSEGEGLSTTATFGAVVIAITHRSAGLCMHL